MTSARNSPSGKLTTSSAIDNASSVPGATVTDALQSLATSAGLLLSRVAYVDPANDFAYDTVGEAVTALSGSGGGQIYLAPYLEIEEDITIPEGVWLIAGPSLYGSAPDVGFGAVGTGPLITGNITFNAGADSVLELAGLRLVGNAVVNGSNGSTLRYRDTYHAGNITNAGSGWCNFYARGSMPYSLFAQHVITGNIDMSAGGGGYIQIEGYSLRGIVTGYVPTLARCSFSGSAALRTAEQTLRIIDCIFGSAVTVTFTSGAGLLLVDDFSAQSFFAQGCAVSNGEYFRMSAQAVSDQAVTANFGPSDMFTVIPAPGWYRCDAAFNNASPGASGSAQLQLRFTDPGGLATVNVGTSFDITNLGRTQGSYTFYHTGSANIQRLLTGISDGTGMQGRAFFSITALGNT